MIGSLKNKKKVFVWIIFHFIWKFSFIETATFYQSSSPPVFLKNQVLKINFDNWIFSLKNSILKLIFEGCTGSKNPVWNRLKIQFVELDFPIWIFQKSSTDQQGVMVWMFTLSGHSNQKEDCYNFFGLLRKAELY